jgi:hypothetical protein
MTGSAEKDAYTSLLDLLVRPWARAIGVTRYLGSGDTKYKKNARQLEEFFMTCFAAAR